jgi:hypothetical protein
MHCVRRSRGEEGSACRIGRLALTLAVEPVHSRGRHRPVCVEGGARKLVPTLLVFADELVHEALRAPRPLALVRQQFAVARRQVPCAAPSALLEPHTTRQKRSASTSEIVGMRERAPATRDRTHYHLLDVSPRPRLCVRGHNQSLKLGRLGCNPFAGVSISGKATRAARVRNYGAPTSGADGRDARYTGMGNSGSYAGGCSTCV